MQILDVTNLPKEERLRLFEEWLDARERDLNGEEMNPFNSEYTEYLLEGHGMYLTKEELSDPSFLLEWEKLPEWVYEDILPHIGKKIRYENYPEGVLLGIYLSYVDIYYWWKDSSGKEHLSSCVGHVKYLD
nr:MAG TPA: hypothetical protein [Caudoviricetes sp.]